MSRNGLLYKALYNQGKLLLCYALVSTSIFSCAKKDATIPEKAAGVVVSGDAVVTNTLRPNLVVEETFEGITYFPITGIDLNVVEGLENCGTSWTLSRVTTPVFQNSKSSRFEIRKDQPLVGTGERIRSEATVIKGWDDSRFTSEMWYSFAVFFPSSGFPFDETKDCINQWFENGDNETALRVEMDRAFLEVCPPEGSDVMKMYDLFSTSLTGNGTPASFVPIPKDIWHEFVFHFKHSLGDDGFIDVWRNGTKSHSIKGRNMHKLLPKWKLGLYKNSFLDKTSPWYSRVIYFDNIRVGKPTATLAEMSSGIPVATRPVTINKVPLVNAGRDTALILPTGTLYLNGVVYDADGSVNKTTWTQVSGPAELVMGGQSTLHFKASNFKYGTYVFRLTVTDDQGGVGQDDVTVKVTSSVNIVPVAEAGPDQNVGGSSLTVDGSKSVDVDGSIAKYQWSVSSAISGWSNFLVITSPSAAKTTITGLKAGSYIFKLTVTDNKGATATDKVNVTVSTTSSNALPVARAGADQKITLPATLTLDGSSSTDADGSIAKYAWTKISGPAATITSPSSAKTTATGLTAGTYTFRLTVTDNSGATAYDDVSVTVYAASSITSFTLVNAATETDILTLSNGAVYSVSKLGTTKFNIRANAASSTVVSVKFELTGPESQIFVDNAKPFALKSDDGNGNYYYGSWNPPPAGTYTLKATPYSASNASGTAGTAATIKFSFTN